MVRWWGALAWAQPTYNVIGVTMHEQDTTPEEWRPVVGYEGAYEVSSLGRVKSLTRLVRNGRGMRQVKERVLKGQRCRAGYPIFSLTDSDRCQPLSAHRLVLDAFVCLRPEGTVCRHLDGDPQNNRLENLRWGSHKENAQDTIRHGRMPRGSKRGSAKLTEAKVAAMRREYPEVRSFAKLAVKYGVCEYTARLAIRGLRWAHVPGAIKGKA